MPVQRYEEDEHRLARIDEILKHLYQLEKDTGKIISSLQKERLRNKADMMDGRPEKSKGRSQGRKARKKR
jgi:hypothetical protein